MWQADPTPLLTTPVIPVLTIERLEDAVPLARALVAGGLPVIEVTLRTKAALDAVRAIIAEVPDVVAGIGTVTKPHRRVPCVRCRRGVPGQPRHAARRWPRRLTDAPVPALPGCSTVSEAMMLMDFGFPVLKFFPAESSGGVRWLKAIAAPLPQTQILSDRRHRRGATPRPIWRCPT